MVKTSVFKGWEFRFKKPCECGYVNMSDKYKWGAKAIGEDKYLMPVLWLDNEIYFDATVGFIYCPECGMIEQIKVGRK